MKLMTCEAQQLRNIVTIEKGKPPAQQPYFGHDAEMYLTPEYLRGRASAEPVKPSANAVRVLDGDTIVLWDGSNAGEFFRARRGILASTMSQIIHDDNFDKQYFFYAVKSWESFLKGQTSGSGIPHVDKEVLGKIEIFQFVKPEQIKIAEILSTVDRAIEQTEALIAKQQRIKTGLMQDLLTRGIDEHGNLRSERTLKFKDSPLGRIPAEWEVVDLNSVLKTVKRGPSLSTNNEKRGIIYLTSDNISETGELIWQTIKYLDARPESLSSILDIGDLILNCVNSEAQIGKISFVDKLIGVTTTGFNNFGLTFNDNKVAPKFAFYLLSYKNFQHELRKKIKPAINQSSFSSTDIDDLPIVIPQMREQQFIVDKLDGVSETVQILRKTLSKVTKVKTALMQDLLTGKKRVTELLERNLTN